MENDPSSTLRNIAGGHALARSLHVVADLGVADVLGDEPRTAADIAEDVAAHPDALGRVLRLLAAHGIFSIQGENIEHSPASRLLRADHPQSMRPLVRMFGMPLRWRTYEHMDHAVRTGKPAATQTVPEGFWAYMSEHLEDGRVFNEAMQARARGTTAGILASYDFSRLHSIADIGGGHGHLLRAILEAVPTATGVLFDLPSVVAESADTANERLVLQAGSFFSDPLPTCDAYLLMEIIHDWADSEAVAILGAVKQAAHPGSIVLLIEKMLSDEPGPDWAKMLDIHMLTMLGGRQRTQAEYVSLMEQVGLRFVREIETKAGVSILEAEAPRA